MTQRPVRDLVQICFLLLLSRCVFSQNAPEYGGLLQEGGRIYANKPNPADAYGEGQARFQLWGRFPIRNNLSFRGVFDARIDTHHLVDRRRWGDLTQRGIQEPAGAISELFLDAKLGRLDLRLGNQRIRWGRADGFNPTDNIIPYDYLVTFDDERLSVSAAKADLYLGHTNLEGVWLPFYTPSRLPLLDQRWFPHLPPSAPVQFLPGMEPEIANLTYRDAGGPMPARTIGNGQWGVRLNQVVPKGEFSVSYFDGFDDLPYFRPEMAPVASPISWRRTVSISLNREYYRTRVAGADFASEIGPVGIRGEAAYFDQTDPRNLDHLLYVVGVDKHWGDWFAILQYAGQKLNGSITDTSVFPDLGLRSTLLWRVERTLGPSRTLEIKGALRVLDGDFVLQPVYSVAISNRWRARLGGTVFAGPRQTYFGQFRDSSHVNLQLTYAW